MKRTIPHETSADRALLRFQATHWGIANSLLNLPPWWTGEDVKMPALSPPAPTQTDQHLGRTADGNSHLQGTQVIACIDFITSNHLFAKIGMVLCYRISFKLSWLITMGLNPLLANATAQH